MRSYFWVREHSRGNVYSYAQDSGKIGISTLESRNDSVASAPASEDSLYPCRESILVEFPDKTSFEAKRNTFIKEFTRKNSLVCAWNALDPAMAQVLSEAQTQVCSRDEQVAITAYARMLNKTLIHYDARPSLPEKPCGCTWDNYSHVLMKSNGGQAHSTCSCARLVFYHPYTWGYNWRAIPKPQLRMFPSHEWVGATKESIGGNAYWDVSSSVANTRFVDFASFANSGYAGGAYTDYTTTYTGNQKRVAPTCYGVLEYCAPRAKNRALLGAYGKITRNCYACGSSLVFVAEGGGSADHFQHRQIPYNTNSCMWEADACGQCIADSAYTGARFDFYSAYSAVKYNGELGTPTPYPRDFVRETEGEVESWNIAPSALRSWLQTNLAVAVGDSHCAIPAYDYIMQKAGKPIGLYRNSCGREIGAKLTMGWCGREGLITANLVSDIGCGDAGEYVRTTAARTIAYISPTKGATGGWSAVTVDAREDVTASVDFGGFELTAWGVEATVRFVLAVSDGWETFPSNQVLAAWADAGSIELPVYIDGYNGNLIPASVNGVETSFEVSGGKIAITLGMLINILRYSATEDDIFDVVEVASAGIEVIFHLNQLHTGTVPYVSADAIHLEALGDSPAVDWSI